MAPQGRGGHPVHLVPRVSGLVESKLDGQSSVGRQSLDGFASQGQRPLFVIGSPPPVAAPIFFVQHLLPQQRLRSAILLGLAGMHLPLFRRGNIHVDQFLPQQSGFFAGLPEGGLVSAPGQ